MSINDVVSKILQEPHGKWTTVNDVMSKYDLERRDAFEVLTTLKNKGLGELKVGRGARGKFPTRLVWATTKSGEHNEQESSLRPQGDDIDYEPPLNTAEVVETPQLPKSEPAPIESAPRAGMRKEVIPLDEGDVIIHFPEVLSADSLADLEDHLKLFIRKVRRRASSGSTQ